MRVTQTRDARRGTPYYSNIILPLPPSFPVFSGWYGKRLSDIDLVAFAPVNRTGTAFPESLKPWQPHRSTKLLSGRAFGPAKSISCVLSLCSSAVASAIWLPGRVPAPLALPYCPQLTHKVRLPRILASIRR